MSKLVITIDGYTFEVELSVRMQSVQAKRMSGATQSALIQQVAEFDINVNGKPMRVIVPESQTEKDAEWFIVDEHPYEVMIDRDLRWIKSHQGIFSLEVQDMQATVARPPTGDGRIKAPIPGQISEILVAEGQEVEAGQALMVLEAMKMENEIRAPRSGRVKDIHVTFGQRVALHELLVEIV